MNMQTILKITEDDLKRAQDLLLANMPDESAAFLLAGRSSGHNVEELIVRRVIEIPKSEYRLQNSYHLDISPRVINGAIALCEQNKLGIILCHSHQKGISYSISDDFGEKRIAETLWQFIPNAPVGSILLTNSGAINGRVLKPDASTDKLSSLTVVGRCLNKIPIGKQIRTTHKSLNSIYDRQVLAFGEEGQDRISKTKVGIVGLGGTGSCTAEQLVRLGVRNFVLIDPDDFEATNSTRIYGSKNIDTRSVAKGKTIAKVEIASRNLREISPEVQIKQLKGNVVESSSCQTLLDRDIIFCCTDDYWGRAVLNQIAYQYLIPVINMGVQIDSNSGTIRGAAGAVHVLRPGKPCLWCYGFLTSEKIRTQSLPPQERESLMRENYVEGINGHAPSVISLTTTISGLAVTQFLQLVTDFMGANGNISCLKYNIMDGTVSRGTAKVNMDCCCQTFKGYGDMKDLYTT